MYDVRKMIYNDRIEDISYCNSLKIRARDQFRICTNTTSNLNLKNPDLFNC